MTICLNNRAGRTGFLSGLSSDPAGPASAQTVQSAHGLIRLSRSLRTYSSDRRVKPGQQTTGLPVQNADFACLSSPELSCKSSELCACTLEAPPQHNQKADEPSFLLDQLAWINTVLRTEPTTMASTPIRPSTDWLTAVKREEGFLLSLFSVKDIDGMTVKWRTPQAGRPPDAGFNLQASSLAASKGLEDKRRIPLGPFITCTLFSSLSLTSIACEHRSRTMGESRTTVYIASFRFHRQTDRFKDG